MVAIMTKNIKISPSILAADFTQLKDQLIEAAAAGADWFHVDVMDGHFVPNISMGPMIVEACRRITDLPLDVHLMIEKPERYLARFAEAGASNLTVHIETCPEMDRTIEHIHELGCKAGITLKPDTPADMIKPYLSDVDLVLVMTVNPGFSGQSFMPEVLPKIAQIRRMLDDLNPQAQIEVDGGISSKTVKSVFEQGARIFVAGSAVFNHSGGIKTGIDAILDQIR
jgi:ribulose-phosphate 3-epimerase